MYGAGVCISYSWLDLFIIKQWPSPPLVPKPSVQERKWPGRAFKEIRRIRNYTCWLPDSYPFYCCKLNEDPGALFPTDWGHCCHQKIYFLSQTKGWFAGNKLFQLSFRENRWDFVLKKMHDHWMVENSIISDRSQNFSSSHTCISTGEWNLSYTWLESREEKFAKCQQAALHSDTLTSVKYIKYWVAVRSIAQFIHIRRPNDRDMDW